MSENIEKNNLKMLIVVTRMDIGGVPEHIMTLINGLKEKNYDITLMCRWVHERYKTELEQLKIEILPMNLSRLPNPILDFFALLKISKYIKSESYDIVNTHTSKATLIGCVAAKIAGVPLIVNTAHNLGFFALRNAITRKIFWAYDKLLAFMTMHKVIMVSQTIVNAAVKQKLIPEKKVHFIRNGINAENFKSSSKTRSEVLNEFNIPNNHVVILTVARLVWFKGLDTLIRAAEKVKTHHSNFSILVVGDGELKEELYKQAKEAKLNHNIIFTGERNDIPDLLEACDIFTLPSVSEGMPITILEAMSQSKPIVATNVGGIPELVQHGESGYLVNSGDDQSLGEHLITLINDPILRINMGKSGLDIVEKEFNSQKMITETDQLYRNFLNSKA